MVIFHSYVGLPNGSFAEKALTHGRIRESGVPTRCNSHHFKADLALIFSECFNLWNLSMLVSSNQLKLQAFFNMLSYFDDQRSSETGSFYRNTCEHTKGMLLDGVYAMQ